ncbi:MAG: hypothetical protein LBG83_00355 [Oscillospiraceae bacterium]|jgi:hypothetical protein|nr:hypothetical protein [Oscillospiraceae bacterium]
MNFDFLVDFLRIPSSAFEAAGVMRSTLSLWRNGKRRFIPGHPPLEKAMDVILQAEDGAQIPLLPKILQLWYPFEPCETQAETRALLARFLCEKNTGQNQMKQKICGAHEEVRSTEGAFFYPRGLQAMHMAILELSEAILTLPQPQIIRVCVPRCPELLSTSEAFVRAMTFHYRSFVQAGHRAQLTLCAARNSVNSLYWYPPCLYFGLQGTLDVQYFWRGEFAETDRILMITVGDQWACEVVQLCFEKPCYLETRIHRGADQIQAIREHMQSYQRIAKPLGIPHIWEANSEQLKHVRVLPDQSFYLFQSIPMFGVLPPERFEQTLTLTDAEKERVRQELAPLLLTPRFWDKETTVRHVFCKEDIEDALAQQRRQVFELSAFLHRRVWQSAKKLKLLLEEIELLLKAYDNYEVIFLERAEFKRGRQTQSIGFGATAALAWLNGKDSILYTEYCQTLRQQAISATIWASYSAAVRDRQANLNILRRLLEK